MKNKLKELISIAKSMLPFYIITKKGTFVEMKLTHKILAGLLKEAYKIGKKSK